MCRANFGHKSITRYSNKGEHESGCLSKDYLQQILRSIDELNQPFHVEAPLCTDYGQQRIR